MEKARGYRLDNDIMKFEDRLGVPCFDGCHRLTYSVIVKNINELDIVVERWMFGSQLRLVSEGVNYFMMRQDCSAGAPYLIP